MSERGRAFDKLLSKNHLSRYGVIFLIVLIILGFFLYIKGLEKNPPGFALDESSIAYNALKISTSGKDEYGVSFPLFFRSFDEYKNPIYIYLLALVFKIFGPSIIAARLLSCTISYATGIFAGSLCFFITRRKKTAIIFALITLLTPWLFDISRLVFEVALYPLVIILLLIFIYRAFTKGRWSYIDCILIALCLALSTYTYSAGRLLGFLMALGLAFFANKQNRLRVFTTWILYGLTLIPIMVFNAHVFT